MTQPQTQQRMIIPAARLSPEALGRLVEEFVTRSGTDYGHREATLEEKCAAVCKQLGDGRALITYDSTSQTCTIVSAEDIHRTAECRQGTERP